jgi:hypothetical protein
MILGIVRALALLASPFALDRKTRSKQKVSPAI